MDIKHNDLRDFLVLTRSALDNVCYSQFDIDKVSEEIEECEAKILELEKKLQLLRSQREQMQSASKVRNVIRDVVAQMETDGPFVINVTN